jgi:AraC-like DNA-binding protein
VPCRLAASEARLALPDFNNITIRIANVTARLAVFVLGLPRLDSIGTLMKLAPAPLARGGGLSPSAMRRVRDYVELHLSEAIELSTMAAAAGLSMHHFARQFKQSAGVTPHRYVTQKRLELAQALLTKTELPVSEIAYAAGFSDQSHLARHFRHVLRTTPRAFRDSRS